MRPCRRRARAWLRWGHMHRISAAIAAIVILPSTLAAQERLKSAPGYDAAQRVARESTGAVTGGVTAIAWIEEGRAFEYDRDGKHYRFEVPTGRTSAIDTRSTEPAGRGRGAPRPLLDGPDY